MGEPAAALPRIVEAEDLESAVELCYREGWTDGLPVIPATERPLRRIIDYLGMKPDQVIGVIPPRRGIATVEKIAINCVMAGCVLQHPPERESSRPTAPCSHWAAAAGRDWVQTVRGCRYWRRAACRWRR